MKVVLVSGVYPPQIGGPSLQTEQIAHALLARGVEVHVITHGEPTGTTEVRGVPVTYLPTRDRVGDLPRNALIYRVLKREIGGAKGPVVVHSQTAGGVLSFLAGVVARQYGVGSLIKYSSDYSIEILSQQAMLGPRATGYRAALTRHALETVERVMFNLYSRVWATTPQFRERLVERFHVPPQRIVTFPNFIELQPFRAVGLERQANHRQRDPAHGATLLVVARIKSVKGVDTCIQALPHLADLQVRLRVAGVGPTAYIAELKRVAQECGVSDRVEFVGPVPPHRVAEEYRQADLLLLASRYEAFGIVLLEAMASRTPIVATNVGGIPAVVEDGVTARLVAPDSPLELASAIRETLQGDVTPLVEAGSEWVAQFDFPIGFPTLFDLYQSLV